METIYIVLIVVAVLGIALGVGLGVGLKKKKTNNKPDNNKPDKNKSTVDIEVFSDTTCKGDSNIVARQPIDGTCIDVSVWVQNENCGKGLKGTDDICSIKINGDCKTKKAGVMTYHSTDCSGKGKKSLLLSKLDGTCQLLEDGMKIPSKAEGIRATCNN